MAGFLTTFAEIREQAFRKAKDQLSIAQIRPLEPYHKDGAKIIREILKKNAISDDDYFNLVGVETGLKLLEKNIFSFHYDSDQVTFQSPLIRRYCEQELAKWKKKE